MGLRFEVRPVDLDESPRPGEAPRDYVLRLAREKAAARAAPGELVLGADTIVVLEGELLGKPTDPAHARRMLALIAGKEHTVLTGVALHLSDSLLEDRSEGRSGGLGGAQDADGTDSAEPGEHAVREVADVEVSQVRMAALTSEQIAWYVDTGEPLDKAGSYAVQGIGALFVESIEGNYSNVVGLPLPLTHRLFARLGYDLLAFRD